MKVHGQVRHALSGAVLAALSSSLMAMSLGDVVVTSEIGQPLTLVLGLEDVHAARGTIKLRVASADVYRQHHLTYFDSFTRTRLVYDRDEPNRVGLSFEPDVQGKSLDIVMDLTQGDETQYKRYHLTQTKSGWTVAELPLSQNATTKGASTPSKIKVIDSHSPEADAIRAKIAQTLAAKAPKLEVKTEEVQESVQPGSMKLGMKPETKPEPVKVEAKPESTPKLTKANAPEIVAAFVKKHGFDPKEAFPVGENMTLWSVAKLYWPSYPDVTLEQLLLAFRAKNPQAFEKGSLNDVLPGSHLTPPTLDEVDAINAYEAFYEVHGAHTKIPPKTQALIDKWDSRRMKKSDVKKDLDKTEPSAVAKTLAATPLPAAESATQEVHQAMAMRPDTAQEGPYIGDAHAHGEAVKVNPGVPLADGKAEVPQAVKDASLDKPLEPNAKPVEVGTHPVEQRDLVPLREATEQVEKAQEAKAQEVQPQDQTDTERGFNWKYLLLALGLLGLWMGGRRWIKSRQVQLEEAKAKSHPVTFQAEIPKMDARQRAALEATCEQAVKQGTTAGAMGVGLKVYAEMEDEEPTTGSETPSMEELLAKSKALIESVDLPKDLPLDGSTEPEPEEPDWECVEKQLAQFLARQDATTLTPIERALNAKLKLAQHFVEQGALEEAKALLEEVQHRGSPEQIQLATRLLGQHKVS